MGFYVHSGGAGVRGTVANVDSGDIDALDVADCPGHGDAGCPRRTCPRFAARLRSAEPIDVVNINVIGAAINAITAIAINNSRSVNPPSGPRCRCHS